MTRDQLEHAIRAACDIAEDTEVQVILGFSVHGVPITEAAILPPGWETRTVRVQNPNTRHCIGWCLEAHDLAAAKLAAFRDKDREFVALLLTEGLISHAALTPS